MGCYSKYARCCAVIVEVFPNIMQELIATKTEAADLYNIVINHTNFQKRLSGDEIITIETLMTDRFLKLNMTLIYKIIKFFNFLPLPKDNSIKNPLVNDTEIGDDVERIRFARYYLAHKTDCDMDDSEFETFFTEVEKLGKRVDIHLRKPTYSGFHKDIKYFKTNKIDDCQEFDYIEAIQEEEDRKGMQ